MSVPIEEIVPGAVFQLGKFQRRVVAVDRSSRGHFVKWERPDGSRFGRKWLFSFAREAKQPELITKPTHADLQRRIVELERALSDMRSAYINKQANAQVCNFETQAMEECSRLIGEFPDKWFGQ